MTRHVKVIIKKTFDGNVETDAATTLAKAIFDTVNGKTFIGAIPLKIDYNAAVALIYDD